MSTRRITFIAVAVVLALLVAACGDGDGDTPSADEPTTTTTTEATADDAASDNDDVTTAEPEPEPADELSDDAESVDHYPGYVSEIYDDPAVWICWPGADDICAENQDLTLISPDGSLEVVPFTHVDDAPVDCFYVYPTISRDFTPNSDFLAADDEEIFTTRSQAARYGSECRVFAPIYRQNTLPSMLGQVEAPEGVSTREVAYADVLDAFKHYMTTANEGRGIVLLGHSQGAGIISRLIDDEIDNMPALLDQFVTAHVLGSSAWTYDTIEGCTEVGELGCVISYATFRETAPPPQSSFFGRTSDGPALCTNPANLDGTATAMQTEYLFNAGGGGLSGQSPFTDPAAAEAITTQWVGYPNFIIGECVDDGTFGYLSVEVLGDPTDPRTDDIGGDLTAEWGLHLADAQVGMGDLVSLVRAQIAAYTS